ncbi:MAG: hypothetical protein LBE09_00640 [Christensenellaceae bacterium]|jgi:hypothetical protein|nr:hypothetical protein [Christensenellaceae bacterium]
MKDKKIIAVDFDGTLFKDAYPAIGEPIPAVINYVKQMKAEGHKLILWTCRCDAYLIAALKACQVVGLTFDAVNANVASNIAQYGNDCRKVFADIYIDDKSADLSKILNANKPIEKKGANPVK